MFNPVELLTSDLNLIRAWKRLMKWLVALISLPTSAAQAETVWYIDPTAGDDGNGGQSATDALQTWAEFDRRTGVSKGLWVLQHQVTVNILGTLPTTDLITIDLTVGASGMLDIVGVLTAVETQTTTAYGADFANNLPQNITAAGWAPQVGNLIIFDTGPAAGGHCWVAKDLGGGQAWISAPATLIYPWEHLGGLVTPTALGGDDFTVYSMPEITIDSVTCRGATSDAFPPVALSAVRFQYLDAKSVLPAGIMQTNGNRISVIFRACRIEYLYAACGTIVQNSNQYSWFSVFDGFSNTIESGLAYEIIVNQAGDLRMSSWPLMVGGRLLVEETGAVRARDMLGIYDSWESGLHVNLDAHAEVQSRLHGDGNTDYGVDSAGTVRVQAGVITGGSGDIVINGQVKAWAETPYFDPKSLACVFPYTLTAFTMANGGETIRVAGPITAGGGQTFLLPDATEQANAVPGTTVPVQGCIVPTNGTIKNLRVRVDAAPGAGLPVTIWRVPVGTSAPAATALTCTVGAAALEAADITHQLTVEPGDLLVPEHNNPGGSAAGNISIAWEVA